MGDDKFEMRGIALAAEDQEELRALYSEIGEKAAAARAGCDTRTYMRAMAGATLYAPTWRELSAFARRLREDKLPTLHCSSNLPQSLTPPKRNTVGRAHHRGRK
jgi:hypothetical protein